MADYDIVDESSVVLRPDPGRTVIRPFEPSDPEPFVVAGRPRAQRIAERILALNTAGVLAELKLMTESLDDRHRDVEAMLMRRFEEVNGLLIDRCLVPRDKALLIGAYFSEEYSYEAAALFNPSIVVHPDQSGTSEGAVRFIMSLRGIGEGHVSSVTFRTGTWQANGTITVDTPSATSVAPRIDQTDGEAIRLMCGGSRDISETVIFPLTAAQRQGIEDVRLVRFVEEGDVAPRYYGTYTAYSGSATRQEMLDTDDFSAFGMKPISGTVSAGKGMALFPRRIGGRYAALTRHDNENIWLLMSDDLYSWNGGGKIITPRFPWEFVQMGNCGSPIEIDEGWLVLTHGVGMVRNYCIGACLLDRDDPSQVLARTAEPILRPAEGDRDGYVPNVVYSCGAMANGRTLLLPYGVADSYATFATLQIDDLIGAMR
jgi:predicted GH43/DUF377 family glycosyl hydrolase